MGPASLVKSIKMASQRNLVEMLTLAQLDFGIMDKTSVHPVTQIVFNALVQRQRALAACKDIN